MAPFVQLVEAKPNLTAQHRTLLVTVACTLLWLSHAIVLDKVRKRYGADFKPEHWIAYVMNRGRKVVDNVFIQLSRWYMDLLTPKLSIPRIASVSLMLKDWLRSLTTDVTFAIDEAQMAQHLHASLGLVSTSNKPRLEYNIFINCADLTYSRTLLSVLALYSLPPTQTRIVTGTRMTDFEQILESGESKFQMISLKAQDLSFPITTPEDAIAFVTQFYRDGLANELGLRSQIGLIAQGRIRRSANLNTFIWYAEPKTKPAELKDYVKVGIEDLKAKIKRYVEARLATLEKKFSANPELHQKC